MQHSVLIIDDDVAVRTSLSLLLGRAGYEVLKAKNPDEAIELVKRQLPNVMLMDMNFSLSTEGKEGLILLQRMKIYAPHVPVILMTAWGSIELAVQGMKLGAFDFITKPWENRQLLKSVQNAIDLSEQAHPHLTQDSLARDFPNIIGRSEVMRELLQTVKRIAGTTASVLITGESGTGKELIAEAIHQQSQRAAGKPFVKVNLGGMPHSLFESEMFGHKKGAFTDAYTDRKGRFAMADGGTIFLDEIGELELSSQVKLLRVLQDQTFEMLGDSRPIKVDVRVVSATNRDLRQMVQEGTFREDLFYRINLIELRLPPLRERSEDIPELVEHFAARLEGQRKVTFSREALSFLQSLPYPGNIRELKNLVERSILMSTTEVLGPEHLESHVVAVETAAQAASAAKPATLEELERKKIMECMEQHQGNISQVARELGISRSALYRRLDKYGL